MAHPGGRPLKYKTVEELQKKIDEYFKKCDSEKRPYTVTGLALALNVDRVTLLNYSNRDEEFFNTIKKAKGRIEAQLEEHLVDNYSGNTTGIIFNLKNNYGWKDKQDIDANVNTEIKVRLDD